MLQSLGKKLQKFLYHCGRKIKSIWKKGRKMNSIAIRISNHAPRYIPEWFENMCLHKNLHANFYNNIIHNSQKMKAIEEVIQQLNRKPNWYICTREYYSVIKRSISLNHANMWMIFKCILLNISVEDVIFYVNSMKPGLYHLLFRILDPLFGKFWRIKFEVYIMYDSIYMVFCNCQN